MSDQGIRERLRTATQGIGQPLVCPAAIIVKPPAAEAVVSNGSMEWVETPAKRDRARSPAKWERANDSAGDRADRPKRASTNGLPGICRIGPRISSTKAAKLETTGSIGVIGMLLRSRASSWSIVSSQSECSSTTAVPSSNG